MGSIDEVGCELCGIVEVKTGPRWELDVDVNDVEAGVLLVTTLGVEVDDNVVAGEINEEVVAESNACDSEVVDKFVDDGDVRGIVEVDVVVDVVVDVDVDVVEVAAMTLIVVNIWESSSS